jgi:hypothetical protein
MDETPNTNPIAITIPTDTNPLFTNATQVSVSSDAVIIQFAYVRPNSPSGQLLAEIILSPKHAIDFSRALDTTIKQHFTRHLEENLDAMGLIEDDESDDEDDAVDDSEDEV